MKNEERLATAPIPKLVLSLALPSIVAQLVNLLYNMVDRMYIGRIPGVGALALTGLGLCTPIILIISAFSAFAGNGGAPLAAIELGKGNRHNAEKILGNAASLLFCCSLVLTVLFLIFKRPILFAFGASDATIGYAEDYLTIYLVGTIFVQFSLGLNMFITSQGQAKTAMLSVLIGAVTNIILDPVFIFALEMGVQGAALATVISQALSAVWVVCFLASKRSSIRLKPAHMRPSLATIGKIAALGISPFIMQVTESLVSVAFNSGLQSYGGDLYVGSMTILMSVMQLCFVPLHGFTAGTQPVISYNYGAKRYGRVMAAFKVTCIVAMSFCMVFFICTISFPKAFARIFTAEDELIALVGKVLPIYMGGTWIFGMQNCIQVAFLGMGQAKRSLFIACLRKIILLIPLALILPRFFGVMGIYWAEPIADTLSAITCCIVFFTSYKKLLPKHESID